MKNPDRIPSATAAPYWVHAIGLLYQNKKESLRVLMQQTFVITPVPLKKNDNSRRWLVDRTKKEIEKEWVGEGLPQEWEMISTTITSMVIEH